MKKSVIRQIFNEMRGYILKMDLTDEYNKHSNIMDRTYDELIKQLSPETLQLHEQFVSAMEENCEAETDFYFVEGFKIGLLVGIECSEIKL